MESVCSKIVADTQKRKAEKQNQPKTNFFLFFGGVFSTKISPVLFTRTINLAGKMISHFRGKDTSMTDPHFPLRTSIPLLDFAFIIFFFCSPLMWCPRPRVSPQFSVVVFSFVGFFFFFSIFLKA